MKTVILTYFADNVKAHMLQDILHNEGMLQGETINQVLSYLHGFEIQVLVWEKDIEQAKLILKESFPEAPIVHS